MSILASAKTLLTSVVEGLKFWQWLKKERRDNATMDTIRDADDAVRDARDFLRGPGSDQDQVRPD